MTDIEKVVTQLATQCFEYLTALGDNEYLLKQHQLSGQNLLTVDQFYLRERDRQLHSIHAYILIGSAGTKCVSDEAKSHLKKLQRYTAEWCDLNGIEWDQDTGQIE